jgi:hypothetical protein
MGKRKTAKMTTGWNGHSNDRGGGNRAERRSRRKHLVDALGQDDPLYALQRGGDVRVPVENISVDEENGSLVLDMSNDDYTSEEMVDYLSIRARLEQR